MGSVVVGTGEAVGTREGPGGGVGGVDRGDRNPEGVEEKRVRGKGREQG